MDNDNSPENFAKHRRAVIVAPAGYGKTELIAQSVACSEGRQLILTHTHAGVDSIRKRIKEKYPVPTSRYYVETIHSFALRTAGSYPKTTGLTIQQPQTTDDYKQIIGSAIELFDTKLGKDILEASYSGIFVDEYQDCGIDQHELICKLAETLPCRVVGDPLQGIFDFGNNKIVDWEKHVFLFFERMPNLEIPYRWKYSIPELGERLKDIRTRLCDGKEIVFRKTVSSSYKEIVKFLNYEKFNGEKVFVICEPKNPDFPHVLAGSLKNRFRTIEPITCKTLIDYAFIIESCQELERLQSVLEFVNKCLKKISTESNEVLSTFIKAPINFRNDRKKKLKQLFQNIITVNSLSPVYDLFLFYEEEYSPIYKRHQLWHEMKKGLCEVLSGETESLKEAVWTIRNQLRFRKNRIPRRCISRTVLLKGLECDHAIIIKPELFDKKNLYVALTRASSKVTIISNHKTWSNY